MDEPVLKEILERRDGEKVENRVLEPDSPQHELTTPVL